MDIYLITIPKNDKKSQIKAELCRTTETKPNILDKKKKHPKVKSRLHPRSKHRGRYDFQQLIATCPELQAFVILNKYQDESIDFSDPAAVKTLNTALLKHHYDLEYWDIPEGYLCPPIPGRAEYIHHMADILASYNPQKKGEIPKGPGIRCLDIGVGANCIYPIIGVKEYGWSFVGADIDPTSLASAQKIVDSNPVLQGKVELRLQKNPKSIFRDMVKEGELFNLCICNPPFHGSIEEAQAGTLRKLSNLNRKKVDKPILNFGGQYSELICEGGEEKFINEMIRQSRNFAKQCAWFSTIVSKQRHLKGLYQTLNAFNVPMIKTIPMGQGNKASRILVWGF